MPIEREFEYRAFISCSHADKAWGDWIHPAVEIHRVPRRLVGTRGRNGKIPARLHPIFRDREELPTSADLGGILRDALERSCFLLVICSPRSAASRLVNEEIRSFNVGRLFVWDARTHTRRDVAIGQGVTELNTGSAGDQRLALSGDGTRVIVAGFDNVARVYTLDDLRLLAELRPLSDEAGGASPAGTQMSHHSKQDEIERSLHGAALNFDGTRALTFDLAGRGVAK